MGPGLDLTQPGPACVHAYREAIGSLTYLVVGTRPHLAFSITVLSSNTVKHVHNPTKVHWDALKRVARYVIQTNHMHESSVHGKQYCDDAGGVRERQLRSRPGHPKVHERVCADDVCGGCCVVCTTAASGGDVVGRVAVHLHVQWRQGECVASTTGKWNRVGAWHAQTDDDVCGRPSGNGTGTPHNRQQS